MTAPAPVNHLLHLSTELAVPSPLFFGHRVADRFAATLERALVDAPADRIFLVADRTVADLHPEFGRSTGYGGAGYERILVDPGEGSKSWDGLEALCEELIARGATKRSVVLAFGGGSVGNLVGLAAALAFRGVRYVEIPTTFNHLTDGVLSNKQAINGRSGKNMFGVYHAPLFVWADTHYLETEPVRSRKAGIAEMVKNALISEVEMIPYLRDRLRPDGAYGADELTELALATIRSKLVILRRDPGEKQWALVLEYGHTFGHAIEWLSHGALLHGECVSVGMKMAAHFAHERGMISEELVELHHELIDRCLALIPSLPPEIDADALVAAMKRDNKRTGEQLRFVLLDALGSCASEDGYPLVTVGDDEQVRDFVGRFLTAYPSRLAPRQDEPAFRLAANQERWA